MKRGFGFAYALRGLGEAIAAGRNMRVHVAAAVSVVVAGLYVRLDRTSWALVVLCIGMVAALELVNTALEQLCDRVTCEKDKAIGHCKDMAAGAVLAASLASTVVAGFVFARPELWRDKPWPVTLMIAGLLAVSGTLFIFLGGRRES